MVDDMLGMACWNGFTTEKDVWNALIG